ncbi:MAG: PIN domain-containing protein, partial [bacterium]
MRILFDTNRKLLNLFLVASVNRPVLQAALESKFKDYEDAVLYKAALHTDVQGIVTRNIADFKGAKLPIFSPQELLQIP